MTYNETMQQRKAVKRIAFTLSFLFMFYMFTYPVFSSDSQAVNRSDAKTGPPVILPDGAKVSERIFNLNGLSNIGRVTPVIYRGAQPLPEGYATLKKIGIRTVINLRTSKSEKKEVEAAGMKSVEIPLNVLKDIDVRTVNSIIDIMVDPDKQPVYVHCRQGQDRTGIVIAAYRMKIDGWSLKDAEAEMQAFGFNDIWRELKEFIRNYAKSLGK